MEVAAKYHEHPRMSVSIRGCQREKRPHISVNFYGGQCENNDEHVWRSLCIIPNDAFGVVGLRAMESPVSRSPLPSFSSLSPLLLVGVYRTAIEYLSGIYPRENLPKQVSKHNGEYLGELYSSLRSRSCCSAFPYRR